MINQWVRDVRRSQVPFSFSVTDITEHSSVTDNVKKHIARYLLHSYRNPDYLKMRFRDKSPDIFKEYLRNKVFVPGESQSQLTQNTRQGDWGEVLSALLLIDLRGLQVPIPKLRWKVNNEKAMFGTDIFAVSIGSEGEISTLVYCEVKTRRTYSHQLAIEAYNSLYTDNGKSLPDIVDFIIRIFYEQQRYDLAEKFGNVWDNIDQYAKNFEIFLIVEKTEWKEETLQRLHDVPPSLQSLNVNILLIDHLQLFMEDVYNLAILEGEQIVYG